MKFKKLNPLSAAKFCATLSALTGVVCGILYSFGGLIIDASTTGLNEGTALAFGALIGMPVYGAVVGFVTGLVGAVVFNAIPKKYKCKVELKE